MFHYGKVPLDQKWHFRNHRSHCHHNANWSPPSIFGTSSWMSFLSSSAPFVIEPSQFWPVLPTILCLIAISRKIRQIDNNLKLAEWKVNSSADQVFCEIHFGIFRVGNTVNAKESWTSHLSILSSHLAKVWKLLSILIAFHQNPKKFFLKRKCTFPSILAGMAISVVSKLFGSESESARILSENAAFDKV